MKGRKDIGITKVADKEVYVEVFYNLVKNLPLTKTIGEFIPENIKFSRDLYHKLKVVALIYGLLCL